MLSTAELDRRPSRPPDYESENRALIDLSKEMAVSSDCVLQKLAETALDLCGAHSAGISLLEDHDQKRNFHWRALAGQWACHLGEGTPRDFGPCGAVLDQNSALLFSHPERDFPYLADVKPCLEEGLLVPFYINGDAIGTIWVVSHDSGCQFDAEDLRVMTNLAAFAAAAYQNNLSLQATRRIACIVESSDDAIVSKNLDGLVITWNAGAERLFGYSAEEIVGRPITTLIPLNRLNEERTILDRIARGERIEHYETVRKRKDGVLFPVSLTISPIRDLGGEIVGASKIARDISAQKLKEEHIALLSREIDHRSKNLLSLVQAVVHFARGDTPDDLKRAIEGRVQALANAHALLEESQWTGAEIRTIFAKELLPYASASEPRVEIIGPSLMLKSRSAQSIAIVVHELLTNAIKYGALSASTGRVRLQWSDVSGGRIDLLWTETNGPPVTPPLRQGFGSRVVEQIIRRELKGDAHFDWRTEGLVCRLVFDITIEF